MEDIPLAISHFSPEPRIAVVNEKTTRKEKRLDDATRRVGLFIELFYSRLARSRAIKDPDAAPPWGHPLSSAGKLIAATLSPAVLTA